MARHFLCGLLLVVLGASACQSQSPIPPAPAPDTMAVVVTPPPPAVTDGGAVLMPQRRQHVLLAEDSLWAEALRIHYNALVFDGHIDTPTLMHDDGYALGKRHPSHQSHVDLPRMAEGGLDAAFFSIYVARSYGEGPDATRRAFSLINEVNRQIDLSDSLVGIATTSENVRQLAGAGKKAVLLGLEGGHALAADTLLLDSLYAAGIRYVTLTHINTNAWADASQSVARWDGLNDLGRAMVRRMNRLGLLVDLSHTSDATFYDALAVSEAPVLLSHSSARALTPNVRNVSDDMLRALAQNGGVIMINFFDAMVNPHLDSTVVREAEQRLRNEGQGLWNLWNALYAAKAARGLPGASVGDVINHIDHAVRVAGIDHVGLGSDFDGVFDLPSGLEDVTKLPWITYGLLKRGYTEADIYKILGGNVLRVLSEAEEVAATHRKAIVN